MVLRVKTKWGTKKWGTFRWGGDFTEEYRRELFSTNTTPQVFFLFSGNDRSHFVDDVGTVTRRSDSISSGLVTVEVKNTGRDWDPMLTAPESYLLTAGVVRIGFSNLPGEYITLFTGELEKPLFRGTKVGLTFRDKFGYLGAKKLGSNSVPLDYYSSSGESASDLAGGTITDWYNGGNGRNPALLVWDLLTVKGGLDSTEGAANPDIDWSRFTEWKNYMDSVGLRIQARFKGETIQDALRRVGEYTLSSFYSEGDGKVQARFYVGFSAVDMTLYDEDRLANLPEVEFDRLAIRNWYLLRYGYAPSSDTWVGVVSQYDTTSISRYGTMEELIEDTVVWHSNVGSATAAAVRLLDENKDPRRDCEVETFAQGFVQQLFDGVQITSAQRGFSAQGMRVEELQFDPARFRVKLRGRLVDVFYSFLILDDLQFGVLDDVNGLL